ncbi:histidine phosphatase family protein [Citrobacter koseri]|uniref:histidine phosphatase family protein n=1 Tax=Citrobacter koseri TaxID=545 RepID=UPI001F192643|nr:histidine phosphatase family protein [Citrobacter koseri]
MMVIKSALPRASLLVSSLLLLTIFTAHAETTVIFLRHGEKPETSTGQFNRALALPSVLLARFGMPDIVYASAPKENKTGSSLRPLTTILPTAIQAAERPVILKYHATQTDGLISDILSASSQHKRVFISREHKNLVVAAKALVKRTGGDLSWLGQDFDSLYVVRLNEQGRFKSFNKETEGLTLSLG